MIGIGRVLSRLSTFSLGLVFFTRCAIAALLLACPLFANPVSVRWGDPEWTSSTHVRIPLLITVDKGWKISGPVLKSDEIGQPTEIKYDKSQNIWHIDVLWPELKEIQLQDHSQHKKPSTAPSILKVDLDVALKERGPACINLVVRGLACSKVCKPFKIDLPEYRLNPPAMTWSEWWVMLGCAFLGGLILNIMPCVLPVLALKLKGLTHQGPGVFRRVCLLTTSGIVAGFWILAGLTIVIKTVFQQQVGWGMHLQNPYFVASMVIVMMVSGFGLLGVFHMHTPQWAGALLAPVQGRSVYTQAFLSGLVAVFLATPCSAPFLGTALGFALTGQGTEIVIFYTTIALGFALPYILGLVFPIHKLLPRPGPWMVTFENVLGWCLMASAGWFIATSLRGSLGLPWDKVALGLWLVWVALPLVALIPGLRNRPKVYATLMYGFPVLFSVLLLILPALPGPIEHPISMQDGGISWEVFSAKRLESALRQGKTVVVDMTGMGCALCMVNKSVFQHPTIQNLLQRANTLGLRGDFTRGDPVLMMFLRKYGRSAIPFNLVIHSNHPKGVVLSEHLSVTELKEAIHFVENPS